MVLRVVEVSWIAEVALVVRVAEVAEKVLTVEGVEKVRVVEISLAAVAEQVVVVERVSAAAEIEQDSVAEWVVIVGVEQILRAAVTEVSWAAELVSIAAGVELVAVVEVSQIVEQISIAETRTEHIRNAEQTAEHDQAVVAARSLHSPFEAIATTATTATRTTAEREQAATDAGNTHSDPRSQSNDHFLQIPDCRTTAAVDPPAPAAPVRLQERTAHSADRRFSSPRARRDDTERTALTRTESALLWEASRPWRKGTAPDDCSLHSLVL